MKTSQCFLLAFLLVHGLLASTVVWAHPVFTNEPAGLTPLTDTIWNATAPTPGTINDPWRYTGGGGVSVTTDAGAPYSGGAVLREHYPQGFQDGTSPGTTYFPFSPSTIGADQDEVFVGFYIKILGPTFDAHPSGINKIAFIVRKTQGAANGQEIIRIFGSGAPFIIDVNSEYGGSPASADKKPNVQNVPILLDTWYKIEWYARGESSVGANDGAVKWWVNGQLVGNYNNVPMDTTTFEEFKFSSTWGGNNGAVKSEPDTLLIDGTYLSTSPGAYGVVCGNNLCTAHESCLSCPSDCCGGGGSSPVCGNGVIEGGEQCDGTNLNGATCASRGFAGGTLSCHATTCQYVTTACTSGGGDTTPPVAVITSPTQNQVLPAGTTQWTLTVTTDEPATCKHHSSDVSYASISNTFNGGAVLTSFSDTITNLQNGQIKNKYVRCQDAAGNAMSTSAHVQYSIATSTQPKTGDLNNDGIVNIVDVQRVITKLGQPNVTTGEDLNGDTVINLYDLIILAQNWG